MAEKKRIRAFLTDELPMLVMAVVTVIFAVLQKQHPVKTLPLLVSLVVAMLLAEIKRSAFLLGGINSLLYALAYFMNGLYFSAVYALLFSCPVQLWAWINWKNRQKRSGSAVELRLMKPRLLGGSLLATAAGWAVLYFVITPQLDQSAAFPALDAMVTVLGIYVSFLNVGCYVESQYISLFSQLIAIVMWTCMTVEQPDNITYLISGIYQMYRVIQGTVNWTRHYIKCKRQATVGE